MNPWKISAQFAAYMWFTQHQDCSEGARGDARKFAKENWVAFLPYADLGVGRLLIAISRPRVGNDHQAIRPGKKSLLRRATQAVACS